MAVDREFMYNIGSAGPGPDGQTDWRKAGRRADGQTNGRKGRFERWYNDVHRFPQNTLIIDCMFCFFQICDVSEGKLSV